MVFNPFEKYGITDIREFKKFPFLKTRTIIKAENKTQNKIDSNFFIGERLLILGEPGLGKTSTLFFLNEMLENKCQTFYFDKLFTDAKQFKDLTEKDLWEVTKKPTFILIDFPDTINSSNFKSFLDLIWNMLTHDNYENINLIFALNISHHDKSFSYSEILGKFDKLRIDRFTFEETKKLIDDRLGMSPDSPKLEEGVYDIIFNSTKGVPRNIVCATRNIIDDIKKSNITSEKAREVIKEGYTEQIINDRVEDPEEREIFLKIVNILENDFGGEARKQEWLICKLKDSVGIGRNKAMRMLKELSKFGLVSIAHSGKNNTKKINLNA